MAVATAHPTASEGISERVLRAVIGGLIAGAVFLGITMWFASSLGDPADGPLMMIATMLQGEDAMKTGAANPAVGLGIHAALSVLFGLVFALVTPRLQTNGTVALVGIIYGALLYVVNFLVISPVAFPIFEMANQPFELAVHIVFGAVLAIAFFSSGVRGSERVFALNARAPA